MRTLILISFLFLGACKQAYDPPVISTDHAYLVVDGFINNGPDSTVITLSRTFKLNDSVTTAPAELSAQVSVQGSDNSLFPLPELGNGNYGVPSLILNPAQQYRLHIATSDGKLYRSDYVPLKSSPPIDSVNWINSDNGLQFYVSTHDPENASHYYRWNYVETYEFHSLYYSTLEYENGVLQTRDPNNIYFCWLTDNSTNIFLGTSAKLARDLIYEAPLALVPPNSWKIGIEYSILVDQYVLTPEAYNFWLNLQVNTEQIGSLFSPEPSTLAGNLHCLTDSTEPVVGYVSAGTLSKQRIFITPDQIPNWIPEGYPIGCVEQSVTATPDSLELFLGAGFFIPIDWKPPAPPDDHVDFSQANCVDCTTHGTNVKPSFWP